MSSTETYAKISKATRFSPYFPVPNTSDKRQPKPSFVKRNTANKGDKLLTNVGVVFVVTILELT